jgi:hypothetical protein
MTDDIVDTLRRNPLYIPTSRINSFGKPQMGFELTSFNLLAADEIERLREALRIEQEEFAACCIDRKETQRERDEARWRLCKVVGDNRGVWGCEIAKENGWDYMATEAKP